MPVEAVSSEVEAEAEAEPDDTADEEDEADEPQPTIDKTKSDANTADKILFFIISTLLVKYKIPSCFVFLKYKKPPQTNCLRRL